MHSIGSFQNNGDNGVCMFSPKVLHLQRVLVNTVMMGIYPIGIVVVKGKFLTSTFAPSALEFQATRGILRNICVIAQSLGASGCLSLCVISLSC